MFRYLSLVVMLLFWQSAAFSQTGALCEPFSENQSQFSICTTHPNVGFSVENDPNTAGIGDYLQLVDDSGASGVCSGQVGSGISTNYTGDWVQKTASTCKSLCYKTRLFSTRHMNGASAPISPITISSSVGTATFYPAGQWSEDGGADSGWHQVCLPIATIDPNEDLPSNVYGEWKMINSSGTAYTPSYNVDWNAIIQNVEQLFLRTDVNDSNGISGPGEVIGYDNFCLGQCPGCEDCELCCPPWSDGQFEDMFQWSFDSNSSYNVSYVSSSALDTQMNAWLSYASSIRPDIVGVNVLFIASECPSNTPTGTPCPTSWQNFDIDPATSGTVDWNMVSWTGGAGVHTIVSNSTGASSPSNGSLDRPFSTNRLYRVAALPVVTLIDGSFDVIGEGWFGDCPIPVMELNFQIDLPTMKRLEDSKAAPKSLTRMRTGRQLRESKSGEELAKQLERMIRSSRAGKVASDTKPEKWTPWLNTDRPGGNGDFQTLQGLLEQGKVCSNPSAIECRSARDKTDWRKTGEVMTCDVENGHSCRNRDQTDRRCQDYEVRFRCPAE